MKAIRAKKQITYKPTKIIILVEKTETLKARRE
jgi:hypothetical protein